MATPSPPLAVPPQAAGTFDAFHYVISDPNSVTSTVRITIPAGHQVKAIPGCMLATSPNIQIKGKLKKTARALFGPEEARHQTFTADDSDGWVLLAPPFLGCIRAVQLHGEEVCIGDDAFLASFGDIESSVVRQGVKKALTTGHGLYVKKVKGRGIVFVCAVGSMVDLTLGEGEQVIVDTGHLVTWHPQISYEVQKASKGWFGTGLSGEGLVSRITGPGRVQIQTRNPEEMVQWMYDTKSPPPS